MTKAKILVVDDEPSIVEIVASTLRYADFEVKTASSGAEAVGLVEAFAPDLVLLDVMMPGMDGFEAARQIRAKIQIPVIFLTAKDTVEDKVAGFTAGGDDYITKPFSLDEISARVKAVLRRTLGTKPPSTHLTFGDIELNEETQEVHKAGKQVSLSPTEFSLLRYFMRNPNKVLSKAQILDHVWHYDFQGDANVVESYVSYLRKKVDTTEPALIHTLRSVGYMLRRPLN